MRARTLRADWLVVDARCVLRPGWVRIGDTGIEAVGEGEPSGEAVDCGDVLAPGMVNAHAHLDLTNIGSLAPPGRDFCRWIEVLVSAKATCDEEFWTRSVHDGLARLLRTGTTCVADIDSTVGSSLIRASEVRAISFREWIGLTEERARRELSRLREERLPSHTRFSPGLSPHAPYTVARGVVPELAPELAQGVPLQMHVLETEEEVQWCERGEGPIEEMLERLGIPREGRSGWGERPIEALERSGLLRRGFSIAHGNYLDERETRLLIARGVGVVFCPGTHRAFSRTRDPVESFIRGGGLWALGTDGAVTGGDLDLRAQARIGNELHPEVTPRRWFEAATQGGGEVLGLPVGRLTEGYEADVVAFRLPGITREDDVFEGWLTGAATIGGVWIGGRAVRGVEN